MKKKVIITAEGDYKGCVATVDNTIPECNWYDLDISGTIITCGKDSFRELTEQEEKAGWMIQDSILDKDTLFMNMACLIAMSSKDPSTKVGAVIVGQDDEVISMGYNGFPRKVYDLLPERYDRPDKYDFIKHAEENAISNAARIGVSCKGARIYIPFHPCPGCSGDIIQAGIKEIIIHKDINKLMIGTPTLTENKLRIAKIMLAEAGVEIREIAPRITDIIVTAHGKQYYNEELSDDEDLEDEEG